jgi:membrane protease YdiL (CAAX protease family)
MSKKIIGKPAGRSNRSKPTAQVIIFTCLTFLISWGILTPRILELPIQVPDSLLVLVGFGPAFSALFLSIWQNGRSGLSGLLKRLGIIHLRWYWYVFVLFGPLAISSIALGISALSGMAIDLSHPAVLSLSGQPEGNPWLLFIPAFGYLLIILLGEEIGWRGYALPRLLETQNELASSLLLGIIWGVWHIPMAWVPSLQAGLLNIPLGWFLVDITGMAILYTFIFVNTQGSLLIALLLHASNNLVAMYLPILPPAAESNRTFLILLSLKWMVVIILLILKGSSNWGIPNND